MKMLLTAALLVASVAGASATDLAMTFRDPETGKLIPDTLSQERATAKCDGQDGGPCLTLGAAIFHALLRPYQDEVEGPDPVKGEVKHIRGATAYRIQGKKEATFTKQELDQAKITLGKLYSATIVYQAYQALEGAEKPK